jgi:4'-phosphopantetheinyl transferase
MMAREGNWPERHDRVGADWPLALPDRAMPAHGVVRCWRILVQQIEDDLLPKLAALLCLNERQRAARLVRPADRRSFTAAHAGVRLLLAAALGRHPREIQFSTDSTGKPRLADQAIEFNLSHGGDVVLVALACSTPVGVDVERLGAMPDRDAIVRRFLHPGEAADMAGLSGVEAEFAFFRCWTRKEAVTKALGLGMSLPLNRYRVACRPGLPAQLLALEDIEPAAAHWSLYDLEPEANHVGAIAIPARPVALICRTLDSAMSALAAGAM